MKIENKTLKIVLALLCLVAVVLAIFVIIGMDRGDEEGLEGEDEEEATLTEEEIAESEARYEAYVATREEVATKAQEFLSADPVDMVGADQAFQQVIDQYLQQGDYDTVESIIMEEREVFAANNLKCEVLDFWTARDYSSFIDSSKYTIYYYIVWLAQDCGNTGLAEEYEQKALEYGPKIEPEQSPYSTEDIGGNV